MKKEKDFMKGIKLELEFNYSSDLYDSGDNSQEAWKQLSTDISVSKFLGTKDRNVLRCNLDIQIPINKLSLSEVNNIVSTLNADKNSIPF